MPSSQNRPPAPCPWPGRSRRRRSRDARGSCCQKPICSSPCRLAQFACRAGAHVLVVVVEVRRPPLVLRVVVARPFLLVDVGHVLLAEGAVVKPVVAHPAVHHGVHGHGNLQRRVRMDHRHQGQKPVVGDAQDADLAVALGNILHQPVDGVVGVGRLVHGRRILRPVQGPVHHVVALGAVLAADVLDHADVAALHDHVGGVVIAVEDVPGARCAGSLSARRRCTACASAGWAHGFAPLAARG